MSESFILGVDLDGVVADFLDGLRPIAAEWNGVPVETLPTIVSYGLPEWGISEANPYEDLHRFAVTQRDLFANLKPIVGAPAALRRLSQTKIRIRIITHRLFIKYFHEQAVTQTTAWLERYGIPYWDLCFMKDKAAVGADLYVEDSPDNVQALRSKGNPTIVFSNSTNLHVAEPRASSWEELEAMVLAAAAKHSQRGAPLRKAGLAKPSSAGPTVADAILRIGSLKDPRITSLVSIGGGEGFSTHAGCFDGKPAFIVDCGTMSDFLDEDDGPRGGSVTVHVFEDETARSQYIDELRRRSPGALGERDPEFGELAGARPRSH